MTLATAEPLADPDLVRMQAAVLDWYAGSARDLAFRRTTDPWAILVSEVMAQQTQAARAAEHWQRFMAAYPTPAILAAASPADVIRAWRGLGYNRRAIALRAAATRIVEDHGGVVPDSLEALVALPGIGPYTARAVLAIAFGKPVAALDTNIRRVVGRAFDRQRPATSEPRAERDFQAVADGLIPSGRAATWTHALMDIGATFCRPRDPHCDGCPLAPDCRARAALEGPSSAIARHPTSKPPAPRFESTTRWLRGRILDRLRDAPDGAWVAFAGPLGTHDMPAIRSELARLATEALLELDAGRAGRPGRPDGPDRARLVTS